MSCDTYTVRLGSLKLAQHMALDTAMLLIKATFITHQNESSLAITIEREKDELCSVVEETEE